MFILGGGALTWQSWLQPTVALSSTKAEYQALTEAGQELLWLREILKHFGFESDQPSTLQTDNMSSLHLSSKSVFHAHTKHIEVHHHWIREVVKAGKIEYSIVQ